MKIKKIDCRLKGNILEQVSEFNYLGCLFFRRWQINREFKHCRMNKNIMWVQLSILFGSESWVDLMQELDVTDKKVLQTIHDRQRDYRRG